MLESTVIQRHPQRNTRGILRSTKGIGEGMSNVDIALIAIIFVLSIKLYLVEKEIAFLHEKDEDLLRLIK